MASFGEILKRERELREIKLREVSDSTKINIRYLEALEQNRFDVLPGGLFNKGFIRAYAAFIGIDGETMVNSYLQEMSARQAGAAPPAGEGPPGIHRPAEAPRRRASGPEPSSQPGPRPLALAFGPPPAKDAPPPKRPAPQAVEAHPGMPLPRAVTEIEDVAPRASSSRPLLGIATLVVGAGLAFILVTMIVRAVPQSRRAAPIPAAAGEGGRTEAHESPAAPVPAPAFVPPPTAWPAADPNTGDRAAAAAPAGSRPPEAAPGHGEHAPGHITPPRPVIATEIASVGIAPAAPAALPSQRPQAIDLKLLATRTCFVQIVCDGRQTAGRVMRAGESETARCLSSAMLTASDADALRLVVNGAACPPIGESGVPVAGYTLRIDDYFKICPPSRTGGDGRS